MGGTYAVATEGPDSARLLRGWARYYEPAESVPPITPGEVAPEANLRLSACTEQPGSVALNDGYIIFGILAVALPVC